MNREELEKAIKERDLIVDAVLDGVNLKKIYLEGVSFLRSSFIGANFEDANLRDTSFRYCDLRGANFSSADFSGAEIYQTSLAGANLFRTNFKDAIVLGINKLTGLVRTETWHHITISQVLKGWIVFIGCRVYLFNTFSEVSEVITLYIKDPDRARELERKELHN